MHESSTIAEAPPHEQPSLPLRGVFHPLGFALEIRTNDPGVLNAASGLWGHMRPRQIAASVQIRIDVTPSSSNDPAPPPIFRAQRHLLTLIADAADQATCDLATGFGFACLTTATIGDLPYFSYYFLESMAMILIASLHAPAIHAACVRIHGRGMLLHGRSGAGKSTLAYACARAGFTYITDDASYLLRESDHPRVAGQPDKIRFRPSCRDLFPELRNRAITPRMAGKPSIEVPTSELPGLVTAYESRIHYLILLRRQASGHAALHPIATPHALVSLHDALYPVEEIRQLQIAALDQLQPVESFELVYSSLEEAIRCLETLARTSGQTE